MGALSSCHPGHAAHAASRNSPRGSLDIGIVAPDSKSNVNTMHMKNPALFCFPSHPDSPQPLRTRPPGYPRGPTSLQRPPSTHITIHQRHVRHPNKMLHQNRKQLIGGGNMDAALWPSSTSSSPVAPSPRSVTPPTAYKTQNIVMTGFAMLDEIEHSKTQTLSSNTATNSSKLPFPAGHDDLIAGDSNSSKLQHPIVADEELDNAADSSETDEDSDNEFMDSSLHLPSSMEDKNYVIMITSNSLTKYQYHGSALAGPVPVAAKAQHKDYADDENENGLGDEELLP